MNGYVEKEGKKFLWVAKRSQTKPTFPGMLDHLVAGGLVINDSKLLITFLACAAIPLKCEKNGYSIFLHDWMISGVLVPLFFFVSSARCL